MWLNVIKEFAKKNGNKVVIGFLQSNRRNQKNKSIFNKTGFDKAKSDKDTCILS